MKEVHLGRDFHIANRKNLVSRLPSGSTAVINANDQMPRNGDQYYPYRQNSDFFYLTGITQEKSILSINPGHPDKALREILFILKANPSLEKWEGHKLSPEEAEEISGIRNIRWLDDFELVFRDQLLQSERLFLNSNEYPKFKPDVPSRDHRFAKWIEEHYPSFPLERLAPLITMMRMVKSKEEIEMIRKAAAITGKAFAGVMTSLKPGMWEYEVEAEITYQFIRSGASGHAYMPIIAAGANACALHYVTNHSECKSGDLLLLDFGAEYGNYAADCSRTIPVDGHFSNRQKDLYKAVYSVFTVARDLLKPGITIKSFNDEVNKMWQEEHLRLGLYSKKDLKNQEPREPLRAKYYPHGTAHFIGLDVHDVGFKHTELAPGMVLTCEPGIYIDSEGIGIRLENDILITADGNEDLMKTIPMDIEEIEEGMKR